MTSQPAALPPAPPTQGGDPVDAIFTGIDAQTGEELPTRRAESGFDAPVSWQRDDIYHGIAELQLSEAQIAVLTAPVIDAEIEIKPDSFGAVYLSHSSYRKRLNAAFKPGGWSLRQIGEWRYDTDTKILSGEFALYARGSDDKVCFVGKAIGGQKYYGGSGDSEMTYDDASEGATSNALMRCCKQLGIAIELWEKRTATAIRNRLGVLVKYAKKYKDNRGQWVDGQTKVAWRRWDDDPIKGEIGLADDSPNKDKYQRARPAQQAQQAQPQAQTPQAWPSASPAASPAAQPSAARPADYMPATFGEPGYISEPQAKRLFAITKKSGISEEAVSQYLRTQYAVRSSKQIKKTDYQKICEWVQRGGD